MKLFSRRKNKEKKKEKQLVIKNGKNDTRVYPEKTLLASNLKHEE